MEKILEAITLSRALGLALFLASIWLMAIILKKQKHNLFRGILFFLFLLLAFLYVNESDSSKLTLNGLIHQYFPTKALELNYRTASFQRSGGVEETVYYFNDPRPPLKVSMDDQGKYSHIIDPTSLNRVLKQLGLPEVKEGARELASITGSNLHGSVYQWKNYPRGFLTVEKTRYQNRDALVAYDCIAKISISPGY